MKNKLILVAVFALAALLVWSIFSGPTGNPAAPLPPAPVSSGTPPSR